MKWVWVCLIVGGNVFFWMVVYYAQQASKELGATDYTNKHFYEPVVNLGALASVMCLFMIYDLLV